MKAWFSSGELEGLPGLPTTERRIREKAKRDRWESRPRQGKGGGVEYNINSLPETTQSHLRANSAPQLPALRAEAAAEAKALVLKEQMSAIATTTRQAESLRKSVTLSVQSQARIDAKLAILREIEALQTAKSIPFGAAIHAYIASQPPARGLGYSTIWRWKHTLQQHGVSALAGVYHRRAAGYRAEHLEIQEVFLAVVHQHPTASAAHILNVMSAQLDSVGMTLPTARTVQRWLDAWKKDNAGLHTYLRNPNDFRNHFLPAFGSYSEGVIRLNQLWEIDSSPADIMLNGQRYTLIHVIDVYSRLIKPLVTKTSKATAIALALRRCILDWGVPETLKTDNGQDYIARYLSRVLDALQIEHQLCQYRSPWQKPHVERSFRTFAHGLAELLPGFIGHNVADAQAIRARQFADRFMTHGETVSIQLSPEDFQLFCDRWADDIYAHRTHSEIKTTPSQRAADWIAPIRRIPDVRTLDLLLAEAPQGEFRTVQKKGVFVENAWYIAPELARLDVMRTRVRVLLDPLDMGRVVILSSDFKFICVAEDPSRTGIDRQAVAAHARNLQKANLKEAKEALKAASQKVKIVEVIDSYLQIAAEKAKVIDFPALPAPETHTTPALEAAAEALQTTEPKQIAPLSDAERAHSDAIIAEWTTEQETDEEPWQRYCRLFERQQAGLSIAKEEADWMVRFAQTPEGQGLLMALQADDVDLASEQ